MLKCIFSLSVSLQDIHLKKAFRSNQSFDQQVVARDTMPKAMQEAYMACDKPPPLDKLNPYRYSFTTLLQQKLLVACTQHARCNLPTAFYGPCFCVHTCQWNGNLSLCFFNRREDGKDGLKFYTDPNYFFELWRQEMLKDTERMMHDRGKKVRARCLYIALMPG